MVLRSHRLLLRLWVDSDLAPFAELNSDPTVMEYFPRPLSRSESDALAARIRADFEKWGFGLWAVQLVESGVFAGFIGLSVPSFQAHFTPCVEIGWRLASAHWGRGLATEGARRALAHGFDTLGLDRIVSFTVPANLASRRVMEKLGMHRSPADDFDHPHLPEGHPLRRHVLYRLTRAEWHGGWTSSP